MLVATGLRAVTPETAQRLGMPAEAPLWVSPQLRRWNPGYPCAVCDVVPRPLAYAPGQAVRTLHQVPGVCPGIYHFHRRSLALLDGGYSYLTTGETDCAGCLSEAGGTWYMPQYWYVRCAWAFRLGCAAPYWSDTGEWALVAAEHGWLEPICAACIVAVQTMLPWVHYGLPLASWRLVVRAGEPAWRFVPPRPGEQNF